IMKGNTGNHQHVFSYSCSDCPIFNVKYPSSDGIKWPNHRIQHRFTTTSPLLCADECNRRNTLASADEENHCDEFIFANSTQTCLLLTHDNGSLLKIPDGVVSTGIAPIRTAGSVCTTSCKVSNWSDWSECKVISLTNGTFGITKRRRFIIEPPSFSEEICPPLEALEPCKPTRSKCSWLNIFVGGWGCNTSLPYAFSGPGPAVNQECQRDCVLSNWEEWSECADPCDTLSTQQRRRHILLNEQKNGESCGSLQETRSCFGSKTQKKFRCGAAVDCKESSWGLWSPCSLTCQGGTRSRHRNIETYAQNGGRECAALKMVGSCNSDISCDTTITDSNSSLIAGMLRSLQLHTTLRAASTAHGRNGVPAPNHVDIVYATGKLVVWQAVSMFWKVSAWNQFIKLNVALMNIVHVIQPTVIMDNGVNGALVTNSAVNTAARVSNASHSRNSESSFVAGSTNSSIVNTSTPLTTLIFSSVLGSFVTVLTVAIVLYIRKKRLFYISRYCYSPTQIYFPSEDEELLERADRKAVPNIASSDDAVSSTDGMANLQGIGLSPDMAFWGDESEDESPERKTEESILVDNPRDENEDKLNKNLPVCDV
ncbi:thrombospondin type 1 domain-containing protein, partial [Cardiosporidium cionae]